LPGNLQARARHHESGGHAQWLTAANHATFADGILLGSRLQDGLLD